MNPKIHPLTTVVKLIKTMQPADAHMYSLYAEAQDIHIAHSRSVPKDAPIIARLTPIEIDTGLLTDKWNHIDMRIRKYTKKGILEWNPQKP